MKMTSSKQLLNLLYEMGLDSAAKVIEYLPYRYDSFLYTPKEALAKLQDKQKIVLLGHVLEKPKVRRFRGNLSVAQFYFRDIYGRDYLVEAWNRPYLSNALNTEDEFTLQATYDQKGHKLNLITEKKGRVKEEDALIPKYHLPADYPPHAFRQLIAKCLKAEEGKVLDRIPAEFQEKYRLLSRYEALQRCHFPKNAEDVRQGQRVLKYEEALFFSLKNQLIRLENKSLTKTNRAPIDKKRFDNFLTTLPYPLTKDQQKAVNDALEDMDSPSLMYRLLQGDVGTGKTLVAALLMYANFTRGEQSAFLAPTDSLARQHYESLCTLFERERIHVRLLVGSLSPEEHRNVREDIEDGTADIVVGTHALFAKKVQYANLGLVLIDEQHKFGVNQRATLVDKGENADLLLMSATPIPRTLSLTLYGDLDVSTLNEFPSKKRQVTTRIVPPKNVATLKRVALSVGSDHRVYIVAPQIENAEEKSSSVLAIYESYSKRFPGLVSLLHGKMSPEEKEEAVERFRSGKTPILISTSVIEVGIDVKQADLMVIYDPTHFALSSLHQLRGRIGRSGEPAECLLVYDGRDEDELDKLNVLVSTEDGFQIAEEDLRRRGPGDIAGIKQSGLPDFLYVNPIEDIRMFECARDDAAKLLKERGKKACRALFTDLEKVNRD